MSPRRHVDDLFSAAYEDDLSPIDEARFHAHLQSCAPCAAAFAEFSASVEALRELPRAPMPRPVHLPSTPPVAERTARGRISLGWLNAGLLRRFPATAAAAAIAAVLVIIAVTHGTSSPTAGVATFPSLSSPASKNAPQPQAATASCTQQIVRVPVTSLPADFSAQALTTSPSQPGLRLVLATSNLEVTAGKSVDVYAQLVAPISSYEAPGAATGAGSSAAFRPCVSIEVGGSSLALVPKSSGGQAPGSGVAENPGLEEASPAPASAMLSFDIPAGLASGTELHLIATVPAGSAGYGSPALTATLTLTIR